MRKITMAATLIAVPKDEQWSVIQFLLVENVSTSETHERMCAVYGALYVTGDFQKVSSCKLLFFDAATLNKASNGNV